MFMLLLLLPVNQLLAAEPQVLEKSELVLESGDRTFLFEVEVAAEAEERRVGLMHRREMAPDAGMLFDFGRSQPVSMWMRNTYIPLDMLFIDEGGAIVNIAHDTVPHSEEVLSSAGPVRFVLELVAGTSRLLGLSPGDIVRHEAIGNMQVSGNVNG
jgi:uncharacterized membrane protein (UPF0127 family)